MRIVYIAALLAGAHLAFAQTGAYVESFPGCYELRVLERHVLGEPERLPRRFRLSRGAHVYVTPEKNFVQQDSGSNEFWSSELSSWNATDRDTLQVIWSTGFIGWDIRLNKSRSELRGWAHYFTDTDSDRPQEFTARNSLPVAVRKTECRLRSHP